LHGVAFFLSNLPIFCKYHKQNVADQANSPILLLMGNCKEVQEGFDTMPPQGLCKTLMGFSRLIIAVVGKMAVYLDFFHSRT